MNITVNVNPITPTKFPRLIQNPSTGTIICQTNPFSGFIVYVGSLTTGLGVHIEFQKDHSVWNLSNWVEFNGSVTFSND